MEKKYYALYTEMKRKILSGEYRAEERLPSKRTMADRRGISIVTVERAYGMLEDEGYIVPRERSGYYVSQIDALPRENGVITERIKHIVEEKAESKEDFEYSVWFKTVRRVISEQGERLFIKSPNKGCPILRNAIADYLYRYRGMLADPRRIIIGSGSEQLYETAVKLLGRERIYGIEDPSYEQIALVYGGMGVGICRLAMGREGIESDALLGRGFDVLHVTPFHSYPSGVTTSVSKRYEYLKWAKDGGRYIIEDDFDSETFLPGNPIESLYSLDHGESVIYINTFSKSLSPSMRIGYMILPEQLMERYESTLGMFSCSVPVMDQYILAEFIRSGSFERHLNRARRKSKRGEQKG